MGLGDFEEEWIENKAFGFKKLSFVLYPEKSSRIHIFCS
jgi:hypothetical protein